MNLPSASRGHGGTCSLSLDLDNKWSYLKTHGDAAWETHPSYLNEVVQHVLPWLAERDLNITFFVVGQDAALPENYRALRAIGDAGHEIGNHSFHHEPWLHLYSPTQLVEELKTAAEAIENATGAKPAGFRGPGYSVTPQVWQVLEQLGYGYDASTLPTFIGPLARAYYFMTAKLSRQEREQRKALFGKVRDAFLPLKPYRVGDDLVEIPVTTFPLLRAPIHFSYLLYLSCYSQRIADAYWNMALMLCRWSGISPSLLLHPLDFLGEDEVDDLDFFPGMTLDGATKRARLAKWMEAFATLI